MLHSLYFCAFVLVLLLFQTAPKHSDEVLSSVPKTKKAMITEKVHLLGKSCSGMSYTTGSLKFNVNESTIYIKRVVLQQTQKTMLCIVHSLISKTQSKVFYILEFHDCINIKMG